MNIDNFREWALGELGFDIEDPSFQTWVDTNVRNILLTLQDHRLLGEIQQFLLANQAGSHRRSINISGVELQILTKSFKSIRSKLFRINVVENHLFPEPPSEGGWVAPHNLYERLNDLARATIICRHIDEPRKISNELKQIGEACGVKVRVKAQAKELGYYAYHVYFSFPVQLVTREWAQSEKTVDFEVQITTQMQYILYELTHVFYDAGREVSEGSEDTWKWDYKSPKFTASYLSHTLHLLEGMIVSLYEKLEEGNHLPATDLHEALKKPAEESD